jgi:hypothetical protein
VNASEIKRALAAYRPGTADVREPEIARALELAARDPEVSAWLKEQAAVHEALRELFDRMPVPDGLRDRILGVTPFPRRGRWPGYVPRVAAAAAVVVALGWSAHWLGTPNSPVLADFRGRMVRAVLREYRMDIQTGSMAEVRDFLRSRQAPADYRLPPGLGELPVAGGGRLTWQSQPVSMVCFDRGEGALLFLFVLEHGAVPDPPRSQPEFVRVNRLMTASWSQDDLTYVLAGELEEASLRRYL